MKAHLSTLKILAAAVMGVTVFLHGQTSSTAPKLPGSQSRPQTTVPGAPLPATPSGVPPRAVDKAVAPRLEVTGQVDFQEIPRGDYKDLQTTLRWKVINVGALPLSVAYLRTSCRIYPDLPKLQASQVYGEFCRGLVGSYWLNQIRPLSPGAADSDGQPLGRLTLPATAALWSRLNLPPTLNVSVVLEAQDTPGHSIAGGRWEFQRTFRPSNTAAPNSLVEGTAVRDKAPRSVPRDNVKPDSQPLPPEVQSGKPNGQATKPVSGITSPVANGNSSPPQRASQESSIASMVSLTSVLPDRSPAIVGRGVVFTVYATGDCQRGRIDFGDGSPVQEFAGSSSTSLPPHTYTKPGTFNVKVFGINEVSPRPVPGGCFGKPPARILSALGLGEISVTPSPASALQPATITVDGIGACGIVLLFGDASAAARLDDGLPQQITHSYLHGGTYTLSAKVVAGSPCSPHRSQATLKVSNAAVVHTPCTLEPPMIREVKGPYGKNVIGPDDVVQVTGDGLGNAAGEVHIIGGSQFGSVRLNQFTEWRKDLFRVRIPHITSVLDQPVRMEVAIPPGCPANTLGLKFKALREERLLPGHMVRLLRCSDEGKSNDCSSSRDLSNVSLTGWH
ncbi:MAG TPA: PKD domain-containing protein, partial [Candidatus Angelobacter sp.]|nr:PKD domain-containing protein [Candidatus Angelobacter sp.]